MTAPFSNGRAAYFLIAIWIVMAGWLEWALVDHLGEFSESMGLLQLIRVVAAVVLATQSMSRNPKIHWAGLGLLGAMLVVSILRFGQFQ